MVRREPVLADAVRAPHHAPRAADARAFDQIGREIEPSVLRDLVEHGVGRRAVVEARGVREGRRARLEDRGERTPAAAPARQRVDERCRRGTCTTAAATITAAAARIAAETPLELGAARRTAATSPLAASKESALFAVKV